VVGVDVGGTKVLAASVEVAGVGVAPTVLDRELEASRADTPEVLERIEGALARLLARAEVSPSAIGVGLAGFVDRSGIVRRAPNAAGLVGADLAARLEQRFGLPTFVDNDANCVAVTAHHTSAPDSSDLVAVTLGTGIGGGLVVGGRLLRGANGFAGEPGHMVVVEDGLPCPCGQRGCWERYASGSALGEQARTVAAAGGAPGVVRHAGSVEAVTGAHVTDLLERDPDARWLFDAWCGHVAAGLANLLVLLDPEVVVIGGGLSAHGELLGRLVTEHLDRRFPAAVQDREFELLVTPGGPEAGAVGAALLGAYQSS
jgi:glucokinase